MYSFLAVLPLHGKDNTNGTGTPVNLLIYQYPELLKNSKPAFSVSTGMHLTHNLEPAGFSGSGKRHIYIAGKEGFGFVQTDFNERTALTMLPMRSEVGAGELRVKSANPEQLLASIEPMHGNMLVTYESQGKSRTVLDSTLSEGHALAVGDFLQLGNEQVVAGWRKPNKDGMVGIKIYFRNSKSATGWDNQWIDQNGMACEDIQVADLDADGRLDIIASGRATRNLKIYWNKSVKSKR